MKDGLKTQLVEGEALKEKNEGLRIVGSEQHLEGKALKEKNEKLEIALKILKIEEENNANNIASQKLKILKLERKTSEGNKRIEALEKSFSWKITAPFRNIIDLFGSK